MGVGIKNDTTIIEKVIRILTKEPFQMKKPVDIEALAVLAGWRLESRNMTSLALGTLGCTLNKISSCADFQWPDPFRSLAHSMQVYANGDVKVGFLCLLAY